MRQRAVIFAVLVTTVSAGCLEQPSVGRAADPARAPGPAPWGSATSNADLDKKLRLLDDILDGKLKTADLPARVERDYPNATPDERQKAMGPLTDLLAQLKASGQEGQAVAAASDRAMAKAQLYFSERRFIEAATLLSQVLDQNAIYPGARNLLARCFFFLQNRDRTIVELEFVLGNAEQQKNKDEVLDALFLLGAAVAETPGMSRENLDKGKGAWETYLKLAPESPQRQHIENGLKDIEAGLRGEGPLAQPLVSRGGEDDGSAPSDVRGGARAQPMGQAADGPVQTRVAQLPADASPRARTAAEGLDALDTKDLATAEAKLKPLTDGGLVDVAAKDAMVGLGRIAVQTGRIDDALRAFGEVIKVDPTFMPAWHYNGMAHMMSGSPKEAVQSWQKIVEQDPAYAARFKLDQRIEVAKRMAR